MGASESYPSNITVIKPFKKLVKYIKNQEISNKNIKEKLKSLYEEVDKFFAVYNLIAGKRIDENISPYFIKIEEAVNSFQKCADYIDKKKRSASIKPIKETFRKDFASFKQLLADFARITAGNISTLQKYASPALYKRFYVELSMFNFALTVQNLAKRPFYQLSTLPAYSLHDQILKTNKKCISIIGPHESGKTTIITMLLACRSLSKEIKSKFIILIENNPSNIHGIVKCLKELKKKKSIKNDHDDAHEEVDHDHEEEDEEEADDDDDDDDSLDILEITSSFQKVTKLAKLERCQHTVIAVLSPIESLQLFHDVEKFSEKAIFIFDDVHQRSIETDVLYQDVLRGIDRLDSKQKAVKITFMSPVVDSRFLDHARYHEDYELNTEYEEPAKKKVKTYDSIEKIGKVGLIKEMRDFFNSWIEDKKTPIGTVIAFVPKAKTGKKLIKNLYKIYNREDAMNVIPLRTKIRKGEKLEPFIARLNNDIEAAAILKEENPEEAAKVGVDFSNKISLLPIDLTSTATNEEKNFINCQLPDSMIKRNLVRLIITTNRNESFYGIPDLNVIFDSGLTETEYYDIEKGVSIYKEELLPTPYINEHHNLLGEGSDKIHFVFEVKDNKRPKDILPAVKRCNMAQAILKLRSININFEDQRNLPSEPNHEIKDSCVKQLVDIGIIDPESKKLTDIGKIAAKFSTVSPFFALATAKFADKQEFAFLISLIIERSVDLIENNNSQLFYNHFCSESDIVTIIESILALNVDDTGKLIDENDVKLEESGLSEGSLYSIYTTMANTFKKDGQNEGRKAIVEAIKWAHGQPGGTLGMVDKYVKLLDQNNFLNLRKGTFEYVVGAGPGCEPTLVYKAHDNFKFNKDKDAHVKFSQRPGWLGLQSPGNIIILSLLIEESVQLNRGLLIHRDPNQIDVNPGVISHEEANPSLNSYFFTALFEAYWSGQPTTNNFIGIYHSNKPIKENAFLINICESNKRTFVNYCPKNAAVKNEMNAAIPLLANLMPYVPRSVIAKSDFPLCIVEVITYGTSKQYETKLFIVDDPGKRCPMVYPVTKALLEYANRKINDLRQSHPKIRFAITGESVYYRIKDGKQLDADFSYPNADPTIQSVFHPEHPSHLVFIVDFDYADKPGVPQIPWLPPAGAEAGVVASNDANEIKLMTEASTKILNGLGYANRSDDFFFITLDGGFPKPQDGTIPDTLQNQVEFDPAGEGAIKQGVDRLVYEFTRVFSKEQTLKNPITLKQLGSTSNCKRYNTEDAKRNILNQINAALVAQFGLTKEDVVSTFLGPSMICANISKLPENLTQHPKQKDMHNKNYVQCPADAMVSNSLKAIGVPVTTVTHEPTITVTVQHYKRLGLTQDQFEEKIQKISDDFGFLLAVKPEYFEGADDLESERRGALGRMSVDLMGKTACVAFSSLISNEFPVTLSNDEGLTFTTTMTMTMTAMTTMRTARELDPTLGPIPRVNPVTQKAICVPHGEINAIKDLVKRNNGWKFDDKYRVLIIPFDDENKARDLMRKCRNEELDSTCFYACDSDEPILLPQVIYANEKDGTIHPYGVCKGCTMSIFTNDETITTIFNPITRLIDQVKLKTIESPLKGFTLIDDELDKETGLTWPQIPFGQVIWTLLSDPDDELTPFIKAWFTIAVEYTIQKSNDFIFCPDHPAFPIPMPPLGNNVKCRYCNMMFCGKCAIWHPMDRPCEDDFDPAIKRCPNCKLPSFKVAGCNRITCPRCNQSWCYQCGLLCGTVDATYAHIAAMRHYA